MIKIGANFMFCLSSAMLHFKDQV